MAEEITEQQNRQIEDDADALAEELKVVLGAKDRNMLAVKIALGILVGSYCHIAGQALEEDPNNVLFNFAVMTKRMLPDLVETPIAGSMN